MFRLLRPADLLNLQCTAIGCRVVTDGAAPTEPLARHTVVVGDNLWNLAIHFCGDGRLYRLIAEANHIPNPSLIVPGQVLGGNRRLVHCADYGDHVGVLTPLALGVGPVALVVGFWLLSTVGAGKTPEPFTNARRVSLIAAGAVMIIALFWLTNIFATAYGENEAKSTAAKLWSKETGVTLYTSDRLGAPSNLIVESVLQQTNSPNVGAPVTPTSTGTFRYLCLRALVVRGDRWVLVPARWTPEFGYAVIVDANASNRISVLRLKGIGDTGAVNWAGNCVCPELATPTALDLGH